jgi:hypothetical protein
MEAILGAIEDSLDRLEKGSPDDKEDAKMELKANLNQFTKNLQDLAAKGNAVAAKILERLQKANLN